MKARVNQADNITTDTESLVNQDNQVQNSAEQTFTPWQRIYNDYKKNTEILKAKYSPLLNKEILFKQSKDIYSLANIFKDIAEDNIVLARASDTNQSLKLQYYNDSAIACHHGLSVIEKANCNNDLRLQTLENEVCSYLDLIQIDMVSICGGNLDLLQHINTKADLNNISKSEILEQLRTKTKGQLEAIEAAKTAKNDPAYIELTANIFKGIASEMENYVAMLYKEAEEILGTPPCNYTVIGLGSMSLRQMTPYSDLEFAILTDNDTYKQSEAFTVKEYFRNLTHLVHFKVINLGETIIPTSAYNINLATFIRQAVNFDLGGKTPLGRIEKDKPYELIQTVEEMLSYLRNEGNKTDHIDKNLTSILQKVCFIYGNEELTKLYQEQAQKFLSDKSVNGRPNHEARAIKALLEGVEEIDYTKPIILYPKKIEGNLKQFSFNANKAQGKLFDVKQEIYRMSDRFIYNLGFIHGVQEESGWETVDKLCAKGIISKEGAANLKKALSFATNLRLKTYSHYGCQKDSMDYAKAYDVQSDLQLNEVEKELTTVFKLAQEELEPEGALFDYYYTALALRKKLKEFCKLSDSYQKEGFFNNMSFYQDDVGTKAEINLRLLRHNKALAYQLEELDILIKSGESKDLKDLNVTTNLLNNIGITYIALGKYMEALAHYEKVLELYQSFGEDHPTVATNLLNNTGYTYGKLGNLNKALEYQIQALAIFKKSLGGDHPTVATSLDNIGCTYGKLGNLNKALEYQIQALAIFKKSLGGDHQDVATNLDNIGYTYGKLGKHEEALEYQIQALKIWKKSFGEDHPDVATNLNNIGITYGELGKYEEALEYTKQVLAIRKKSLGDDHPDVAISLDTIGCTYGELGNHEEALEYQIQALAIRQKSLGDDHPDVAQSLNNIGYIYGSLRNHNKALEYQIQALAMMKKSLGEDHPTVATSLNNIGYTYEKLGEHQKALEYWTKALEIWKKSLGEDHPYVATSLNEKIEILSSEGTNAYKKQNYGEAIEKYNLAIKLIDKILSYDANSINTKASLYYNIARSYHNDNNLEQALINYNNTYQLNDKHDKARDYFYKCATDYAKNDKAIVTEESTNIIVSGENILKTLDLLIKLQTTLSQDSTKNNPAIYQQLNLYKKEYKDLKKSIDDKQLALQEKEEYLVVQKHSTDEQNSIQLADKTLSVLEANSSFEDMPDKVDGMVRVISYNITADFFDNKDTTVDQHHHWQYRAPFVKVLLKGLYPDIMCLQELSAEQALELHQYFNKEESYKSIFLSQTPSEIETGAIAYGEDVKGWCNKYSGASLIGTFINKSFEFVETGRFWLNENPDLVPTITDRGEIDKGFGNMNTYRAVLWAKVQLENNKSLYIFNSHYPLSGNNETRFKCAQLEMNKIQEIAEGNAWISAGDRNLIPTKDDNEQYNPHTVYDELTKHGKNIIQDGDNHYGPSTTWIGFTYDEYKNEVNDSGEFADPNKLDVIVSNLDSTCSFHHHGAFDPIEFRLLPLTDSLTEEHTKQRYFASDHALIGADLVLDTNLNNIS